MARRTGRNLWCMPLLMLGLGTMAAAGEASAAPPADADGGDVLAWIRFDDAPEVYAGTRYLWLGAMEMRLVIDVPPRPDHVIELLWGAKNDARAAAMTVSGREVALAHGGYDGFRWLRAPAPPGLTGDRYEVVLKPGAQGKPAFLAQVRLATRGRSGAPAPDMKAAASKITLRTAATVRAATGEAFPEMRKVWDRQPAPPAAPLPDAREEALFRQAEENARRAAEALFRCRRFVDGWLAYADPATGLIPRNIGRDRDLWNPKDAAADNYPFMVLTCALTDRPLFEGRMLEMLRTETRLTSRIDRMPDDYLFSKSGFATEKPNFEAIVFGSAEYAKDGLVPLTEWLGASPWSERMAGIIDDVWKHAPIDTPFGKVPTLDIEVSGDLLQACSRLYWFTGQRKYLDWAIRLGDHYLLGSHHPTRDLKSLRLIDHGCEVVNGLSELYVAVWRAAPEKKSAYEKPLHEMLDRILEVGRNEDGMLYVQIDPKTGEHSKDLCDTWGYDYDAFYAVYLVDKTEAYRQAVRKALGNLKGKYVGAPWADRSADGYADSIEGAINLLNREPVSSAAEWVESQTRMMWAFQKSDGVIEGWHGDGNVARTTIMYALWRSQGVTVRPWRADVRAGAAGAGGAIRLSVAADEPWKGQLVFDRPRHRLNMHMPLDYPRINQFPEWFTVEAAARYAVRDFSSGSVKTVTGAELEAGLPVELKAGVELRLRVEPAGDAAGPDARPK